MDRAVKTCIIGTAFSVCITYGFFILVRLFPASLLRLFGDDPKMIQDGVTYLSSFSFDFLIIPFVFCINGFLIGGGHTLFTLINSMMSSVFLRVPVCYFFGVILGWGLKGVGMGAPVASAGVLLLIIVFLLSGRWKHNMIKHSSTPEPEPDPEKA
jgi:Na+-driven multidrug efflux pump